MICEICGGDTFTDISYSEHRQYEGNIIEIEYEKAMECIECENIMYVDDLS